MNDIGSRHLSFRTCRCTSARHSTSTFVEEISQPADSRSAQPPVNKTSRILFIKLSLPGLFYFSFVFTVYGQCLIQIDDDWIPTLVLKCQKDALRPTAPQPLYYFIPKLSRRSDSTFTYPLINLHCSDFGGPN